MANVSLKSKMCEMRLELLGKLGKSGKNSYSKYDYFQLADFVPQIVEMCNKKGVFIKYWVDKEKRELPSIVKETPVLDENSVVITTIKETKENFEYVEYAYLYLENLDDSEDNELYKKETANVSVQGAQPIQNLGGKTTYMKRYMYMDAFDITENDFVEENTGKPEKVETKTVASKKPATKKVETKPVEAPAEEVKPADFEPAKEETTVEVNSEELMSMAHKVELATFIKSKGLDAREVILECAKEIGTDVPLLKESDVDKIKEIINRKVGK